MTLAINSDADVLARTIYGEARGEGYDGMKAVACVVLNRVAKPGWWGTDIKSVCLMSSHGIHQFSCWNADDPNLPIIQAVTGDDDVFSTACGIAQLTASGDLVDNTNGATNYYAKTLPEPPYWARGVQPCADIGNQLFFKLG
jgi:N-acetylmuramoyl-L-alanine amidase